MKPVIPSRLIFFLVFFGGFFCPPIKEINRQADTSWEMQLGSCWLAATPAQGWGRGNPCRHNSHKLSGFPYHLWKQKEGIWWITGWIEGCTGTAAAALLSCAGSWFQFALSFQEFPKDSMAGLEQLGDVSLPRPSSLMKFSYSRRMPTDIKACLARN